MKIGTRQIGNDSPVFFIAEIGVNHNGELETAKKLIDVAVDAKADAVKFQTFVPELLASSNAPKAKYQENETKESQLDMLRKYQFAKAEFLELKEYCKEKGIIFISTPFDLESLDLLFDLGVDVIKIGSGDLTDLWLLEKVAELGLPVILSTGMSNLSEIEEATSLFQKGQYTILHCVSSYPTPKNQVNLNAINTLKSIYPAPIGFSDHTQGNEIALAAVAIGAKVIEKHFTLDRNLPGPDHKSSIEPDELKSLISEIRNIEKAFGNGIKEPQDCEIETISVARKSIVAKQDLQPGEKITRDLVLAKRPGNGIPIKDFKYLENRVVTKFVAKDSVLTLEDFE